MKPLPPDIALTGGVTLPVEAGYEAELLSLVDLWKPDAIRDSDGTRLSDTLADLGLPVYSTTCVVRADQDWARERPDQLARKFLLSDSVTATGETVSVRLLAGYCAQKYRVDAGDPARLWEVTDRTTGQVVAPTHWTWDPEGLVTITGALAFHRYTVTFLVWLTWDSTSMYNHLTNGWTSPPVQGVDPYLKPTWNHLMDWFEAYLDRIPHASVVRLTTLAYHFVIDSDETTRDRYRDWHGYGEAVSPEALDDFARENGYRLRGEHLVDQGYYNAVYRVPSREYRDWMSFVHRFVVRYGTELVRRIHARGKQAAVFWGDHWVGMEPYSPLFQTMGVDINIGACEDGVALRRLADSPGPQTKEIRLYPYFFPDVFRPGNDPVAESRRNWVKIRRALLRQGIDRIGHGGYVSLALKFPEFVAHVAQLCDEFRRIRAHNQHTGPWSSGIRVAVVDAWGPLRSWINHTTVAQKFHTIRPDTFEVAGSNALECLAGLAVEVSFLSFDEIRDHGVPVDLDVLLCEGEAGTAWSGGHLWDDPLLATAVRAFVHAGGAWVGIGDPSALDFQGQCYQLADVMGVQKETGQSINHLIRPFAVTDHFITSDGPGDFGPVETRVFPVSADTQVLAASGPHVGAATHEFGAGRSVFLAGLPYSPTNSRLLDRALFWAARRESDWNQWRSDSSWVDVVAWPERGVWAAANASPEAQRVRVYRGDRALEVELGPYGLEFWSMD